jgi:hypothetical protein
MSVGSGFVEDFGISRSAVHDLVSDVMQTKKKLCHKGSKDTKFHSAAKPQPKCFPRIGTNGKQND